MRHHHHRALPARQVPLQPLQRGQVKVVGRLVQQQQVRFLQQQLAQRGARLLPPAQVLHRGSLLLAREAQPVQHLGYLVLVAIAAGMLEALL